MVTGIADPLPGQASGYNGGLHAENFYPDDLLSHCYHTGLDHPALIDQMLTHFIGIQVEGLPFSEHGLPAAAHHAAALIVVALHDEVDLRAQPGVRMRLSWSISSMNSRPEGVFPV
mgnify:CR=1 FL=1